jgi:hypothetical protein
MRRPREVDLVAGRLAEPYGPPVFTGDVRELAQDGLDLSQRLGVRDLCDGSCHRVSLRERATVETLLLRRALECRLVAATDGQAAERSG